MLRGDGHLEDVGVRLEVVDLVATEAPPLEGDEAAAVCEGRSHEDLSGVPGAVLVLVSDKLDEVVVADEPAGVLRAGRPGEYRGLDLVSPGVRRLGHEVVRATPRRHEAEAAGAIAAGGGVYRLDKRIVGLAAVSLLAVRVKLPDGPPRSEVDTHLHRHAGRRGSLRVESDKVNN